MQEERCDRYAQGVPYVSIGLPVYNGARFLEVALNSLLGQSFTKIEVVICDNASTDGTQQICERVAAQDRRVAYYRNAQNLGLAPNFNKVFKLSTGRYFKWAAYDDVLEPTFVERCVEVLDTHPHVAVCHTEVVLIDECGRDIGQYIPQPDVTAENAHARFGRVLLCHDHHLVQMSGLMRADLIRQTRLYESYPCSDEVLLAHMALMGSFYIVPQPLFRLRVHADQSTKGVLASERARVAFVDTRLEQDIVLVKWLYLKGCVAAINSADLSLAERAWCYGYLMPWLFTGRNWRSLAKDVLLAVHTRVPLWRTLHRDTLEAAKRGANYRRVGTEASGGAEAKSLLIRGGSDEQ